MRQATSATKRETAATPRKRRTPEDLRERMLRAAREQFNRHGPSDATTASIARAAEVTEAQLFRYFPSKAELFREAVFAPLNQHFIEFNQRLERAATGEASFGESARAYTAELLDFLGRHGKLLLALLVAETYAQDRKADGAGISSLAAYFDKGAEMLARHAGDGDHDPRLTVRVSFAAVLGAVLFRDWLFPNGSASDEQIEQAIVDFVVDGLGQVGGSIRV